MRQEEGLTSIEKESEPSTKDPSRGTNGSETAQRSLGIAGKAGMALLILAVLYTIYFARSLLLPIFLALFLSAFLQPLVKKLNRLKIPDSVGAAVVISFFVGALTAVAMGLLGMPTPGLWGAVAFVLHFIPFLGPIFTFLILFAVSATTFDTWLRTLLPPLIYLVLAMMEGYIVTPMILGRRLTLNPIMAFVAFLFWGWMWGIPGVFLAVPILTGLKIICDDIEWLKPVGQVLGSGKAGKTG